MNIYRINSIIYVLAYNSITALMAMIAMACAVTPFGNSIPGSTFANIGVFLLGVMLLTSLLNSWFTGKHFDNTWKEQLLNNNLARKLYFSLLMPTRYSLVPRAKRGAIYASHIVMKNKSKNNLFSKNIFNGYDFRANARFIDKLISYLYALSLCGSFLMFFIFALMKAYYLLK